MCAINIEKFFNTYPPESIPDIGSSVEGYCKERAIVFPKEIVQLKATIKNLKEIQNRLTYTKKNTVKEAIKSLLATCLAIGVLAGGIFGMYYYCKGKPSVTRGIAGSIILTSALLINIILSVDYIFRWSDDDKGCMDVTPYNSIFVPIVGPFIPIYMTYGKSSRLTKSLQEGAGRALNSLEDAQKFFRENSQKIETLIKEIEEAPPLLQQTFHQVQSLPIKVPEAESALTNKLTNLAYITQQLKEANQFYQVEQAEHKE